MTRSTCVGLVLIGAVLAAGCGRDDLTAMNNEPARPPVAQEMAGEKEAIDALKERGANVALDEQGRAKVLRLTGPKITDAEMEHVAKLTELRALYLEGTKVTDAGMAHLEPLTKLEKLHCVVGVTSRAALRTVNALRMPTQVEFIDCPLSDVVDTLEDFHGISFKIDEEALKAAGCTPDAPITAKHEGLSLREVLAAMLEPLGLIWTIHGETLVVTTEAGMAEKWPNLAKLREAVPSLADVTVDFDAAAEPASEP